MLCTTKLFNPVYLDHIGARALDHCTHGIHKVGQVHHLRLFGGIFQNGPPFRSGRRQHQINRSTYAHYVKVDMSPL